MSDWVRITHHQKSILWTLLILI